MDQPTTPKRKPGRPRKQKQEAGIQSLQASKASEPPKEGQGQANTSQAKDSAIGEASKQGAGESTAIGRGMGAAILPPLPPLRVRGELATPVAWVKSLTEAQVEAFATAWIATGKRTKWLFQNSDQFGRENASTRGAILRELEAHPVCKLTVARLTDEVVMSDLERRRKLKEIANAPEHGLRGFADNLKAIELDSKADPESVENKRKSEAANSLTFNAPVSLFFMPSTQARAIQPTPEPNAIEVVAKDCTDIRYNDKDTAALPLPPVGGTPGT